MSTALLGRLLKLEATGVELFQGRDEQGAPSYTSLQSVDGFAKKEDKVVRGADGTEITTTLSVWYPAEKTPVPTRDSRITYPATNGLTYIVVERKEVKSIAGVLHHTRVRCKDE